MAPKTDLLSRQDFLRLVWYGTLGLGMGGLAACDSPAGSPRPEATGNGEQNVNDWLTLKGFAPEFTTFVPNKMYGETRAYRAMSIGLGEADQNYQLVKEFFGPLLAEQDLEVIPVSSDDVAGQPEVEAILKQYMGEDGQGLLAAGVLLGGTKGLEALLRSNVLVSDFWDHMKRRRDQEIANCKAGKEKGVGHRAALMMVILGAAAAALEAGKPGILGVTMQAISRVPGPSGESLHALFTVPMDSLDEFLLMVSQSRDTMMLRNLVEWKDVAGKNNAVVRIMIEQAGPATAHFLTGGADRLKQVIDGMPLAKSQFGRQLDPKNVAEYLGILTGLKLLYKKGLERLGKNYQELCNAVGKPDKQATNTPEPKKEELMVYDQILGLGVNVVGEPVWLGDLAGKPSEDNSYFMIMPGLNLPNAILTLP